MNRTLLLCLAGLGAAVGGFWIGFEASPRDPALSGEPTASREAEKRPSKDAIAPASSVSNQSEGTGERPVPAASASMRETVVTILDYPSGLHRTAKLRRFFDRVPAAQFPALLDELRRNKIEPQAIEMLFRVWAERDPENGARHILMLPADSTRSLVVGAFVRAWGRHDLEKAKLWARQNLSGIEGQAPLSYLDSLTPMAPPRKIAEIVATGSKEQRQKELSRYVTSKAAQNPESALDEAMTLTNQEDRNSAYFAVFPTWANKDPLAALRWREAQRKKFPDLPSGFEESAFVQLAAKDSGAARSLLNSIEPGRQRSRYADLLAASMMRDDPAGALAYFEETKAQNPSADSTAFFAAWFEADPAAAAGRFRTEIAQRFPGAKMKQADGAIKNAIAKWAEKDPRSAADFAATLPVETQASVFFKLSEQWCAKDGSAALGWASSLPPGPARDEAMRQFTFTWARHDTNQSTAWLARLPNDSARWAATEGFVFSIIDTDPDAALDWARSIPNESKRLDIVRRAWRQWSQKNSPSAQDWLENGGLNESERAAIQRE